VKEWSKRLARIQHRAESESTVLQLEDGRRAILPRAASLKLMLAIGGVDPTEPVAEWIPLFAGSRPQAGEGQMTHFCRYWCRVRLGLPADHLPQPELLFGGEAWANGKDVHAMLPEYEP
jgi:hypothetical protein